MISTTDDFASEFCGHYAIFLQSLVKLKLSQTANNVPARYALPVTNFAHFFKPEFLRWNSLAAFAPKLLNSTDCVDHVTSE